MKILVSGANGQLGRCLVDAAEKYTEITLIALDRTELDITDRISIQSAVEQHRPDFFINAAAYTAVDKAESEKNQAFLVNQLGSKNLATICSEFDIPLVHVSTDYVFDGSGEIPYAESDQTCTEGVYGESKLAGEREVQKWQKHIIVRTAWVFSEYGNNFVKTMLRLGESREQLSVVNDQIGCPTYATDIADTLIRICQSENHVWGIYHYVGSDQMSWCDFATQVFEKAFDAQMLNRLVKVSGIPTKDYPTPAKRPAYSVLNTEKIINQYQAQSYSLDSALNRVLNRLAR